MKKKGIVFLCIIVVAIVILGIVLAVFFKGKGSSNDSGVIVESVENITQLGSFGMENRFTGVVESQETKDYKVDSSRKIKECFVELGDVVEINTPLFEYDTDELELSLSQANLEIERMNQEINSLNQQIATLVEDKKNASAEVALKYNLEIQSLQNDLKKQQYELNTKKLEVTQIQNNIKNAVVLCEIDGVINSINEDYSSEKAYITVLATGDNRIKGTINELNVGAISEGMEVIIRSRVDENKTWNGTINKIDRENVVESNNNYYSSSDSGEKSSKYNFYVSMPNTDELMLGQHVFVEIDNGDVDYGDKLVIGLWYIAYDENGSPYVWIEKNGKLVKSNVTIGETYDETGECEIIDGLEKTDYIAYPNNSYTEGYKTIHSENVDWESYVDPFAEEYDDNEIYDDEMVNIDEMVVEDELLEDVPNEDLDVVDEQPEMEEVK